MVGYEVLKLSNNRGVTKLVLFLESTEIAQHGGQVKVVKNYTQLINMKRRT
jgi:hypothetical protein